MDFEGIVKILVDYKNDKTQQKLRVLLREAQYMSLVRGIRDQDPETITVVRYTMAQMAQRPQTNCRLMYL